MSEQTHTDNGLTDDLVDVSRGTQTQGTVAEDIIMFEHLLGIHLPENINSQDLSDQIAVRVCSTIDTTRYGITQLNLSQTLNANITRALGNLHVQNSGSIAPLADPENLRRTRLVADAVRESLPPHLFDEMIHFGMPVALDVDPTVPRFHVRMRVAIDYKAPPPPPPPPRKQSNEKDVTIDLRHAFWRERSFQNPSDLAAELKNKTLQHCGIVISNPSDVPASYVLSDGDANRIAKTEMQVINLNNRYPEYTANITYNGKPRTIRVNVGALVSSYVKEPSALRGRVVGSLTTAELISFFSDTANWDWVQGLQDIAPGDRINTGTGSVVAYMYIAHILRYRYGTGSTSGTFASTSNLHQIQQELFTQHQFDTRLREGSDNVMGSAMATTLLMQYHDLRSVVGGRERTAVETDLNTASANKKLLQMLEALEALPLPTGTMSYSNLESRISEIGIANASVGSATFPGIVTIGPGGSTDTMNVPPKPGGIDPDLGPVYTWLSQKKKETEDEMKAFRNIENALAPIADFCTRNGIAGTALQTAVDCCRLPLTLRNPDNIAQNMDLKGWADEIRVHRNLNGNTKDDLDKDVEKFQKELKDVISGKATGPHGDVAQHLVIKEYLKRYRGLTESDATAATNYLRARSKLDGDMTEAAETIAGDLYGTERLSGLSDYFRNIPNISLIPGGMPFFRNQGSVEKRSRRIVYQVGYAVNAPMKQSNYTRNALNPMNNFRNAPEPNWSQANYRSLMTGYFTMKKLYEGGGPVRLKLQQTSYVQKQMREISRALLSKHAQALLRDFGPSLGLTDEQQKEMLKAPTKAEHVALLEQTLQGGAPSGYAKNIEDAVQFTDRHTDWIRDTFITNEKYGMFYGKQNKISARNLLYGNKYASVKGMAYDLPVKTVVGAKNLTVDTAIAAWARRWSIAAGAAIGTLFLPGIGTAIGTAIGAGRSSASKTSASPDSKTA